MPTASLLSPWNTDLLDNGQLYVESKEDETAKLEWLRAAAKEGFDELDRSEGIVFNSMDDLDALINRIASEVSAELKAERACA